MAVRRWQGGAAAVAQVTDWTYSGTFASASSASTFTVGSKVKTVVHGSTVIDTFIDTLVAAWNALSATDFPEFAEMTASRPSTGVFRLTAETPGKPFTATITENDATGTVSAASNTTASSGPNDWSTAQNWSGATVPVSTDDVIIDKGEYPIRYGLAQGGVTLASLKILVPESDWTLGLPEINQDGTPYVEYRPSYLAISATALEVRTASGRVKLDVGAGVCTANVYATGSGLDQGAEALLWKGTNVGNVVNVSGDSEVGIAVLGGEVANIAGGLALSGGQARVRCGAGVTTGALTNDGGALELNSAVVTALTQEAGGTTTIHGAGAVAALALRGGTVVYNTTGTLGGAPIVSGDGVLDFEQDPRAKTVTNPIDLYGTEARILDSLQLVGNLRVDGNEGADPGTQVRWGKNYRLTRGAVA